MKNLIPLNNFLLEEALPLNTAKRYVKMGLERNPVTTAKMDVIFNNKQRLYLPVGKKVKSTIEPQIKEFLSSIGYGIKDYIGNLAFKLDNPKREVKIGKLLSQNGKEDLRNLFLGDPIRELATQQAEYSIVVCRHPYDLAGMSAGTGRESWHSSCLNINGGCNSHYVPKEIKNGTLTVYYIRTEDKNINKPLGRVNVKPYKKEEELDQKDKQKCYFPDTRVYGSFPPDAILALKEWIISWQGDLTGDFYKWKGCYDYAGTAYHISVYSGMRIEEIETEEGTYVDEEEYDPWDDAPEYGTGDVYDQFYEVADFRNYLDEHSDGYSIVEYEINPEYLDGDWYVSSDGYISFDAVGLILEPDFCWINNDDGFEARLVEVRNLTFNEFDFSDFKSFFPTNRWVSDCQVSHDLTFKNCEFGKGAAYDGGDFIDMLDNIRNFRSLNLRGINSVYIEGGDDINALKILTIIKHSLGNSLKTSINTVRVTGLTNVESEETELLFDEIVREYLDLGIDIQMDYA
jgi:hypothetical protein